MLYRDVQDGERAERRKRANDQKTGSRIKRFGCIRSYPIHMGLIGVVSGGNV